MELNDWITILGTLGGLEAIKWMVNFYVNRNCAGEGLLDG